MHMDIFNDDAFTAVSMTVAMEDAEFKPDLIGSMNLFTSIPTATEAISVERRGNELSIIPTTQRGAPITEGGRDGRNIRMFRGARIAKGTTIQASEIQNVRAFGQESDLETMIEYVGRYTAGLIGDVELTWEFQMLGATQGKVLDADGSVLVNWYTEWGIAEPDEIDFALDTEATDVESKCRQVLRTMQDKAGTSWTVRTRVVGLAGDDFFDKLTRHKKVRETYLNTAQAQTLNRAFGLANQSAFNAGSYATFDFGGITFINYRGAVTFKKDGSGTEGKELLGVASAKCRFFPVDAPGVFQKAFAPGESFDFANTIGRELYAMLIRDEKRNFWVRPEVYSYPLFICTKPEMLLKAKAA